MTADEFTNEYDDEMVDDEDTGDTEGSATPASPASPSLASRLFAPSPQSQSPYDQPMTAEDETERIVSDSMDDLFEVPEEDDNDIYVDDLLEVDDQTFYMDDDLSDLTQVDLEDIMGRPPPVRPRPPVRYRRTTRPYDVPPAMGGSI